MSGAANEFLQHILAFFDADGFEFSEFSDLLCRKWNLSREELGRALAGWSVDGLLTWRSFIDDDDREELFIALPASPRVTRLNGNSDAVAGGHSDPVAGGIPLMITQAMRAELRDRGYSDAEIYEMTPTEARQILNGASSRPPPQSNGHDTAAGATASPETRDINKWGLKGGPETVREISDAAKPIEPPPPRPDHLGWGDPDMVLIDEDRTPPPPFDWEAMPPAWTDWIRATANDCGAPADYIAATLIGSASAVIGNTRRVSPWGGWVEQPHLWFALVGQPSTNKTVALAPFKAACSAIEKSAEQSNKEAQKRYAEKKQAADTARHRWKDAVKQAGDAGETLPPMPSEAAEPDKPIPVRVMISDASTEEVGSLLSGNHRGMILVRSELSAWLGQFDRYSGAGSDRAFYLEAWDVASHVIDRVKFGGVPLRVPYASLAIVGSLQPDHLSKVFAGINDGLAARFLYVWPAPVPPRRPDLSGAEDRIRILCNAFGRLHQLRWDQNDDGDPKPMVLRLDELALDVLDTVRHDAYEANQAARGDGVVAGWRGKNHGRLLRLALVFELLQWSVEGCDFDPTSISAEMTKRAARFLDYASAMMSHIFRDLLVTDVDRDAAALARLIKAEGIKVLNEREVYQKKHFHPLREKQRRKSVLARLQEAGWIRPAIVPTGGRPAGNWDANPRIWER
jgi:hypothetical protein